MGCICGKLPAHAPAEPTNAERASAVRVDVALASPPAAGQEASLGDALAHEPPPQGGQKLQPEPDSLLPATQHSTVKSRDITSDAALGPADVRISVEVSQEVAHEPAPQAAKLCDKGHALVNTPSTCTRKEVPKYPLYEAANRPLKKREATSKEVPKYPLSPEARWPLKKRWASNHGFACDRCRVGVINRVNKVWRCKPCELVLCDACYVLDPQAAKVQTQKLPPAVAGWCDLRASGEEVDSQETLASTQTVKPALAEGYMFKFGDGKVVKVALPDPRQRNMVRQAYPPRKERPKPAVQPGTQLSGGTGDESGRNFAKQNKQAAESTGVTVTKEDASALATQSSKAGRVSAPSEPTKGASSKQTADADADGAPSWKRMPGVARAGSRPEMEDVLSSASLQKRCDLATLKQRVRRTRVCTIFLSSVFNGMEGERKLMMEKHKPQLEELCVARGVQLVFVDMRLGITKEMGDQGLTVLTCVRAVEESDIFIGYYAQAGRYGWHGEGLQPSLDKCKTEFPWVEQFRDRSVTEIEWLCGGVEDMAATQTGDKWPCASLYMYRADSFDQEKRRVAQTHLYAVLSKAADGGPAAAVLNNSDVIEAAKKMVPWMEESDSPSFWVDGTPYPLLPSKLSGPDLQAAEQKLQTWLVGLQTQKQRLQTAVIERCATQGVCILDYPDPRVGAQLQWDFASRLLAVCLPDARASSARDDVAVAQEAFARSRVRVARGHKQLKQVTAVLTSAETKPVLVLGEPGGGKSTLAAVLALGQSANSRSRSRRGDAEEAVAEGVGNEGGLELEGALRVYWFVGCNAGSTLLSEMLTYLTARLRALAIESGLLVPAVAASWAEQAAADSETGSGDGDAEAGSKSKQSPVDKFREVVAAWGLGPECWEGGEAPKVVLVLDAVNQLRNEAERGVAGPEAANATPHSLYWLPKDFPPRMRVVITTLSECREYPSGETAKVLEGRKCPSVRVQPLERADIEQLVTDYFRLNFKRPDKTLLDRITVAEQSSNPMFLTVLLEEVICHGTFGEIEDQLSQLLKASDVPGLLAIMLERLGGLFNRDETPDLVGRCLRLVWASREGLQEMELLELLNREEARHASGARARVKLQYAEHWLPLRFAMQRLLQRRGGLWNFAHDFVRQAVERLLITKIEGAGGAKGGMLVEESLREKQVATVVDSKVRRIHASLATFFQVMAAGEDQTSSSLEEQPRCFREMSYHQRQAGLSPSVTVAVRVRPFLPMEMTESAQQSVLKMHGRRTMLVPLAGGAPSVFSYDYSLWSAGQVGKAKLVEQKDVFRLLGSDVIDQVVDGFDVTLLAYGQTGSGKTYSMYGTRENLGLIPRICKALLSKLAELSQQEDLFPSATLSVCEIYCEQVRDLLASDAPVDAEGKQEADKKALKVRERRMMMANGGDDVETYVPDLSVHAVVGSDELQAQLARSFEGRATDKTKMNDASSRSHCLSALTVNLLRLQLLDPDAPTTQATETDAEHGADEPIGPPMVIEEEYSLTDFDGKAIDMDSLISQVSEFNQFASDLPRFQLRAALDAWRAVHELARALKVGEATLADAQTRQQNGVKTSELFRVKGAHHFISHLEGIRMSELIGAFDLVSRFRITRKIRGGPTEGAWVELDLSECDAEERASLLSNLKVGREVQICFDLVNAFTGPRVVVPARLAKYVSRVGFAAGPWSEQIVAQSVGSESCALDSDGAFIVAARPRRLFTVRGSRVSRVNLVDLAGNERVKKSVPSDKGLAEAMAINKSLSALCKTIRTLAEAGQKGQDSGSVFVAYRESNLTRLLRNSLGGTAKIILLAAVSPSPQHTAETLDTLRYASQAKKIVTRATRRAEEGMLALAGQKEELAIRGKALTGATVSCYPKGESNTAAALVFTGKDSTASASSAWACSLKHGESGWLEVDVGEGRVLCLAKYTMGCPKGSQSPTAWQVVGSNADGVSGGAWSDGESDAGAWEVLDAQGGVGWVEGKALECEISELAQGSGKAFRRLRWVWSRHPEAGGEGSSAVTISVGRIRLFSGRTNTTDPLQEAMRLKLIESMDDLQKNVPGGRDGFTPLLKAISDGNAKHTNLLLNAKHTKLLLDAGTPVNKPNEHGMTPLYYAARYNRADIIPSLIQRRADVEAQDSEGRTALHRAARNGNTEALRALLQGGASVAARDKASATPTFLAETRARNTRKKECAALLRAAGGTSEGVLRLGPIQIPMDRCFDSQWNPPGYPTLECSGLKDPYGADSSEGGHYAFEERGGKMVFMHKKQDGSETEVFSSVEYTALGDGVLMFQGNGSFGTLVKGLAIPAGIEQISENTRAAEDSETEVRGWLNRNFGAGTQRQVPEPPPLNQESQQYEGSYV